jgi:UDP-N-acetylglucosamine 2-epimerase (non-hydrolysing)
VTLHRPSNVDDPGVLASLLDALIEISRDLPIVFPVHPRTRDRIDSFKLGVRLERVHSWSRSVCIEFLALQRHAAVVITDSGGIRKKRRISGFRVERSAKTLSGR